jgi:hypothetical protein
MLGQTIFLICVVLTHREVFRDLTEADKISDFLRRQTLAQQRLAQQPKPTRAPNNKHHHHHHSHHHHHHSKMSSTGHGVEGAGDGRAMSPSREVVDLKMVSIEMPNGPPPIDYTEATKSEDGMMPRFGGGSFATAL